MGSKSAFCCLVLLVLAIGSLCLAQRPAGGVVENQILPHMFNLTGGTSTVVLQNLSAASQDIFVEFFSQDGSFFDASTVTVAGLGEAQVSTPGATGGYQGSVLIIGEAAFAARGQWNFNVQGNPLAVGVPALPIGQTSTTFQLPIGTVTAGSLVGVAIANPQAAALDCTVSYRNAAGQAVAEDLFSQIPGFGQVSSFASGIAGGFEGSGSVQCTGAAAVVSIIQEQVNGFPTVLFAVPGS